MNFRKHFSNGAYGRVSINRLAVSFFGVAIARCRNQRAGCALRSCRNI